MEESGCGPQEEFAPSPFAQLIDDLWICVLEFVPHNFHSFYSMLRVSKRVQRMWSLTWHSLEIESDILGEGEEAERHLRFMVSRMPALEHLALHHTTVSPHLFRAICTSCPHLLSFSYLPMPSAATQHLVARKEWATAVKGLALRSLETLQLMRCDLQAAGLRALGANVGRTLLSLTLGDCAHLQDRDFALIPELFPHLEALDLRRCPLLSNEGVRAALQMPTLRRMALDFCPKVHAEAFFAAPELRRKKGQKRANRAKERANAESLRSAFESVRELHLESLHIRALGTHAREFLPALLARAPRLATLVHHHDRHADPIAELEAAFPEEGGALKTALRRLAFAFSPREDATLAATFLEDTLPALAPNLEELALTDVAIVERHGVEAGAPYANLRALSLSCRFYGAERLLAQCPALTSLDLIFHVPSYGTLRDPQLLADIPRHCPQLEHLRIRNSDLPRDFWATLEQAPCRDTLRELELTGWIDSPAVRRLRGDEGAGAEGAQAEDEALPVVFPALEHLALTAQNFDLRSEGSPTMHEVWARCPALRSFALHRGESNNAFINHVLATIPERLEALRLRSVSLSNASRGRANGSTWIEFPCARALRVQYAAMRHLEITLSGHGAADGALSADEVHTILHVLGPHLVSLSLPAMRAHAFDDSAVEGNGEEDEAERFPRLSSLSLPQLRTLSIGYLPEDMRSQLWAIAPRLAWMECPGEGYYARTHHYAPNHSAHDLEKIFTAPDARLMGPEALLRRPLLETLSTPWESIPML